MNQTPTKEEFLVWLAELEQLSTIGATPDFDRNEFEELIASCFKSQEGSSICIDDMFRDTETRLLEINKETSREKWLQQNLIQYKYLRPRATICKPRKPTKCFWAILLADDPEHVTKSTKQIKLTVPVDWSVHHLLVNLPYLGVYKSLAKVPESVHVWMARKSLASAKETIRLSDEPAYQKLVGQLKSTDRVLIWKPRVLSNNSNYHDQAADSLTGLPQFLHTRVLDHTEIFNLPRATLEPLTTEPASNIIPMEGIQVKHDCEVFQESFDWEKYKNTKQAKECFAEFNYESDNEIS